MSGFDAALGSGGWYEAFLARTPLRVPAEAIGSTSAGLPERRVTVVNRFFSRGDRRPAFDPLQPSDPAERTTAMQRLPTTAAARPPHGLVYIPATVTSEVVTQRVATTAVEVAVDPTATRRADPGFGERAEVFRVEPLGGGPVRAAERRDGKTGTVSG